MDAELLLSRIGDPVRLLDDFIADIGDGSQPEGRGNGMTVTHRISMAAHLIAVSSLAALLSLATLPAVADNKSDVIDFCEIKLVARLLSPSSYKRITSKFSVKRLERGPWLDSLNAAGDRNFMYRQAARIRASEENPFLATILIEYDASNGFGAIIRDVAKCEYVWTRESDLGPKADDVWFVSGQLR